MLPVEFQNSKKNRPNNKDIRISGKREVAAALERRDTWSQKRWRTLETGVDDDEHRRDANRFSKRLKCCNT